MASSSWARKSSSTATFWVTPLTAGKTHELTPDCVLDFYVHQSEQRKGHGKVIYEAMLKYEKVVQIFAFEGEVDF